MSDSKPKSPLVVAIDHEDTKRAKLLCRRLDPSRCRIKIANTLYAEGGPAFVQWCVDRGFEVFLDLKFHDIPNQVAGACRMAAELGVWMLNVHALGGPAMLAAAREAIDAGPHQPLLIGVTILTSLDDADLERVGLGEGVEQSALRLARLTAEARLDGIVCSARDLPALVDALPAGFAYVTPGIRPPSTALLDQKRAVTPAEAVAAGATYLVVGRPIIAAEDPMAVIEAINRDLGF